jgi:DNA primase
MRSGNIPDDFIEKVLRKTDIVEVIGRTVKLTKRGKNFIGLCPFHSEKSPSFNVLPEKQIFHCFGCGAGGNVVRFLMKAEGVVFPEAMSQLAENAGIPFVYRTEPVEMTLEQREMSRFIEAHEEAAKFFHYVLNETEQGQAAHRYLKNRGFTQRLIDEFQLGYAPPLWDTLVKFLQSKGYAMDFIETAGLAVRRTEGDGIYDRFRDRVMFPIRDALGKVIAFGGRAVGGDTQPKYLNSPDSLLFHKNKILYTFHLAKAAIRKSGHAVLFEGYVDVIKAWDAGVENGVATLGTALTESHLELLRRSCDQLIICYDGDRAGLAAAHKSVILCEKFGIQARVAVMPDGLDPDEYIIKNGANAFRTQIIERAVTATKYKLLYLRRDYTFDDERGKLSYVRAALSVVATLSSPTEREHYIREISSDTGYTLDVLKQDLHEIRQKLSTPRHNNAIPWNTDMNDNRRKDNLPTLRPAYYNAERQLLSAMMHSGDVAHLVQEKLGSQFHIETHVALAAFLYTYYGNGKVAQPSEFINSLHDDQLEAAASSMILQYPMEALNHTVIDHCIQEIRKYNLELTIKELKEKQHKYAQSSQLDNIVQAAQIGNEIIALEKELKQFSQKA